MNLGSEMTYNSSTDESVPSSVWLAPRLYGKLATVHTGMVGSLVEASVGKGHGHPVDELTSGGDVDEPVKNDARVGRDLEEGQAGKGHGDENGDVRDTVAVDAANELGSLSVECKTAVDVSSEEL